MKTIAALRSALLLAPHVALTLDSAPPGAALPRQNEDFKAGWRAGPLQVELGKLCAPGRVHVFPHWGGRCCKCTVDFFVDGWNGTQGVDMSKGARRAAPQGGLHSFATINARYLRVNMLKKSANTGV